VGGLTERPGAGGAQRLETALLIRAYSAGLFPMADTREAEDVFWVEPRKRGVLPIDGFHLPRSLARVLKQERFLHSCDLAFGTVIRACAAEAPGREQSWINPTIIDAYSRLHAQGHAHSIETWDREGSLAGGLYGVRIGAAFFGESMFSRVTDASKAALAHLVARLRAGGFQLLDTQFLTAHLARFGGHEVRRGAYMAMLGRAIRETADWSRIDRIDQPSGRAGAAASGAGADSCAGRLADRALAEAPPPLSDAAPSGPGPSGKRIVQLLSQTS
jgi:leucyl/phenylalanyl-tRNA--protein transferase